MEITQLEKIGLKEKEAKIYIALITKGESLANQLAKETKILRSSIYDYLEILLEKGFVSYVIKSGKKYFQAVDPNKILDNFEEKKKEEEKTLRDIIPKIKKIQNTSKNKTKTEIFQGKEGIKTVFSYILKESPKEILSYGSSGASYKILPYFMEHWHNQRVKQNINLKIIYNRVQESKERIKKGPSLKKSEIRFLPIKDISLTGTLIYNNKVLMLILNPESPLAIFIESDEISKQYKNDYSILWKNSTK